MRRAPCTLALAALAASSLVAQQLPTFRARVDAVQVDVRVERGGRPVTGLPAANFELRDAGVVQTIEAVTLEDVPVHLLLVLDTSLSVAGPRLLRLMQATRAAIEALRPEDRVTLVTFSFELKRLVEASQDHAGAAAALTGLSAFGSTSLHDAIFNALVLREAVPGRALILVFSDSADTASWLRADTLLDDFRRTDTVVYGVTLRSIYDSGWRWDLGTRNDQARLKTWFRDDPQLFRRGLLFALAEETGGGLYQADANENLAKAFTAIVEEFKSRYLLTYTPEGVPPDGWHPIEVRLKNVRGNVTARRGYQR